MEIGLRSEGSELSIGEVVHELFNVFECHFVEVSVVFVLYWVLSVGAWWVHNSQLGQVVNTTNCKHLRQVLLYSIGDPSRRKQYFPPESLSCLCKHILITRFSILRYQESRRVSKPKNSLQVLFGKFKQCRPHILLHEHLNILLSRILNPRLIKRSHKSNPRHALHVVLFCALRVRIEELKLLSNFVMAFRRFLEEFEQITFSFAEEDHSKLGGRV